MDRHVKRHADVTKCVSFPESVRRRSHGGHKRHMRRGCGYARWSLGGHKRHTCHTVSEWSRLPCGVRLPRDVDG